MYINSINRQLKILSFLTLILATLIHLVYAVLLHRKYVILQLL